VRDFAYVEPVSLDDALARGRTPGSRFLAGGTLLVDLLRLDIERPDIVIDLNHVLSAAIEVGSDGLRIGALAPNTELAEHPHVKREFPVLSEALLSGASPQLRNMATAGGNLLQRTRCSYFRDAAVESCNKRRPGSGCAALTGYSRMHAVLGTSDACIAAHPSDFCVALLALDATVTVQKLGARREVPLDGFHLLPGRTPERETVLERGEVVTHLVVPASPRAKRSAYVKARDRASFAFALASAAVALELEDGEVRSARVALGGVATKPWRAHEVEEDLVGRPATRQSFVLAARLALTSARTTPDNAFKVTVGERVIVRALERAAGLA
jgi:xanthine dehydrogenase YagS FAD-binding subunit